MAFKIERVERIKYVPKIVIYGETFAGKSLSALKIARGLCGSLEKVLVIDTENRAEIHVDYPEFNGEQFLCGKIKNDYAPKHFTSALEQAFKEPQVEVIIIDTLSSMYSQAGGMMEIANNFRNSKGNIDQRAGWGVVNKQYIPFIECINNSPKPIIFVLWAKNAGDDNDFSTFGSSKKFHVKPDMKENFVYNMHLVLCIARDTHQALAFKDNTNLFSDKVPFYLDEESGQKIAKWCNAGATKRDDMTTRIAYLKGQILAKLELLGDRIKIDDFTKYCEKDIELATKLRGMEVLFDRLLDNENLSEDQTQEIDISHYSTFGAETVVLVERYRELTNGESYDKFVEWIEQRKPTELAVSQALTDKIASLEAQNAPQKDAPVEAEPEEIKEQKPPKNQSAQEIFKELKKANDAEFQEMVAELTPEVLSVKMIDNYIKDRQNAINTNQTHPETKA